MATHSITSSARASSVGGISRPILRLMTSANRRLHDRDFARLRAAQNLINVVAGAPELIWQVASTYSRKPYIVGGLAAAASRRAKLARPYKECHSWDTD